MVEIRNDIPPPGGESRRRHAKPYPWATIDVGESFFVTNRNTAVTGCYQRGLILGRKFVWEARDEPHHGKTVSGYRVWRTG